jgi:Ni/Fe-hydrogenase subunit HybB-like protein
MGFAMVIFEGTMVSIGFKRPMETPMLSRLSKYMVGLLVAYLVVRVVDLTWRGAWGSAFQPGVKSLMFWIENVSFALPIALLASAESRRRASRLFAAAVFMAVAGFLLRIDCFLIGYDTGDGWHYFPSIGELTFTVGVISAEILAYIVAVRLLPVLPALEKP